MKLQVSRTRLDTDCYLYASRSDDQKQIKEMLELKVKICGKKKEKRTQWKVLAIATKNKYVQVMYIVSGTLIRK